MKINEKLIIAILTVVLGILFIAYKGAIVSIAMTVFGVALLALAIVDFINKDTINAIIKAVAGVLVIVFGWLLVSVSLYIMAVLLIIFGGYKLYLLINDKVKDALEFVAPALFTIIGLCLLFNQGGTVAWVFVVCGIALIIQGVINLIEYFKA